MDLKEIWLREDSIDDRSFISDVDLQRFSTINPNIEKQREKLRTMFKRNYENWLNENRRFCR